MSPFDTTHMPKNRAERVRHIASWVIVLSLAYAFTKALDFFKRLAP